MKKNPVARFFSHPKTVAVISLVIAGAIGVYGYSRIHAAPNYTYATAGAGTIATTGAGSSAMQDLTLGFVSGGTIASVNVQPGDKVTTGEVLASLDDASVAGALTEAKAAYAAAEDNYQSLVVGATTSTIAVAQAAVNTAQVNLDQTTSQQASLVTNADRNLLNSTVVAQATLPTNTLAAPVISGTYTGTAQGTITLDVHQDGSSSEGYFTYSGLVSGTANISTSVPTPIGTTGLSVIFPSNTGYDSTTWTIAIPNTNAANYLANYNAYQQALTNQTQALAAAQASLTQANANLSSVTSAATPENVAAAEAAEQSAEGAVEVAQGAYDNTIITAPGSGTVTTVSIAPGQVAVPGAPAIELYATSVEKTVAVMVPNSAVITANGQSYVDEKTATGIVETPVTIGVSDATNTEIVSGLSAGDQVVTH